MAYTVKTRDGQSIQVDLASFELISAGVVKDGEEYVCNDYDHKFLSELLASIAESSLAPFGEIDGPKLEIIAEAFAKFCIPEAIALRVCIGAFEQEITPTHHLWKAHKHVPGIIPFATIFQRVENPYEWFFTMIEDLRGVDLVEAKEFIRGFNMSTLFPYNNKETSDKIAAIAKERKRLWKKFLIEVHDEKYSDFFTYTPPADNVARHLFDDPIKLSLVPRFKVGDNVIVDAETFFKRYENFAWVDMFKPDGPLNNASVCIAGGSVNKIIDPRYNAAYMKKSDVDIFVCTCNPQESTEIASQILRWFNDNFKEVYYVVVSSLVNVYIKDIERSYQIVCTNASNPMEMLENYDLTHIQWMTSLENGVPTVMAMPLAAIATRESMSRMFNIHSFVPARMIKTLMFGYDLAKSTQRNTDALFRPEGTSVPNQQMQKIINDLNTWYYPTTIRDYDEEMQQKHIIANLTKSYPNSMITTDHAAAAKLIVPCGNFKVEYAVLPFSRLTREMIDPPRRVAERAYRLSFNGGSTDLRENFAVTILNNQATIRIGELTERLNLLLKDYILDNYLAMPVMGVMLDNTSREIIAQAWDDKTRVLGHQLRTGEILSVKFRIMISPPFAARAYPIVTISIVSVNRVTPRNNDKNQVDAPVVAHDLVNGANEVPYQPRRVNRRANVDEESGDDESDSDNESSDDESDSDNETDNDEQDNENVERVVAPVTDDITRDYVQITGDETDDSISDYNEESEEDPIHDNDVNTDDNVAPIEENIVNTNEINAVENVTVANNNAIENTTAHIVNMVLNVSDRRVDVVIRADYTTITIHPK